jgi:hypothetical protein
VNPHGDLLPSHGCSQLGGAGHDEPIESGEAVANSRHVPWAASFRVLELFEPLDDKGGWCSKVVQRPFNAGRSIVGWGSQFAEPHRSHQDVHLVSVQVQSVAEGSDIPWDLGAGLLWRRLTPFTAAGNDDASAIATRLNRTS